MSTKSAATQFFAAIPCTAGTLLNMPSDTNVLKFIRKCLPFVGRRFRPGLAPALTTYAAPNPVAAEVIAAFRLPAEPDDEGDTRQVKWLDISVGGFAEQQRGRPLAHLVKELLQNALDATDDKGIVDLWIAPGGPGMVSVLCSDNGLGADVETVNVMFLTGKKDSVLQRGRMGRGFKEVLSVSSFALVKSRGKQLAFDHGEHGPTVRRRPWSDTKPGFHALFDISHDGAIGDALDYLRTIIPNHDTKLSINGRLVAPLPAVHVIKGKLDTETFQAGAWQRRPNGCEIRLIASEPGEVSLIYEMGIPVCPVEWPERYHCNILQRVPMNPNRDAVVAGYAGKLRTACFPTLLNEFDRDRALAPWTWEAAANLPYEMYDRRDQMFRDLVRIAYGRKVVRSTPPHGRYDFDATAKEMGYSVVQVDSMHFDLRSVLREVTLTSEEAVKKERDRRLAVSTRLSLDAGQVAALLVKDAHAMRAGGVRQAIAFYGKPRVIDRMEFALWLTRGILEQRGLDSSDVTVRCAWMPAGTLATWSTNSALTLSLAHDPTWSTPIGSELIALVVHEVAHDRAFHHGANFTDEVEKMAGACGVVLLQADGALLAQRFGTWATGLPRNPQCPDGAL